MFDDQTGPNNPGGQQRPPGDSVHKLKIPVITWVAWIGIIVAMTALLIAKHYLDVPAAAKISQAEFLDKLDSNQITSATVVINQQALPLVEISGTCLKTDKDGQVTKEEIPFTVHNFLLTTEAERIFTHSPKVSITAPNTVLTSLLWSIAPFLILGVLFWFFFLRQIKARRTGD